MQVKHEVKLFKAVSLLSEVQEYFSDLAGRYLRRINETELRKDLSPEAKKELVKRLNDSYNRAGSMVDTIHFAVMLILKAYLEYYKEDLEAYPEVLDLCKGGGSEGG